MTVGRATGRATERASARATGQVAAPRAHAAANVLRRLAVWADERFPAANALLFLALHLGAVACGRVATDAAGPAIRASDLLVFPAVWAFFLTLRILDEHKDLAHDRVHHPDRPVPRGLVSLAELRGVAAGGVLLQAGTSIAVDGGLGAVTWAWLAVVAWTTLMTVEFFAADALRRRPVLYAASHLLVLPLAALWMARTGTPDRALPIAPAALLAALAFVTGAAFEVARKTRAPADERAGVDSYTKRFGVRRAPLVLLALLAGEAFLTAGLLAILGGGSVPATALLGLAVPGAAVPLLRFRARPSSPRARAVPAATALATLTVHAVLIAALATGAR